MNQPQLFDGGRLIGATLLCLVLGTWISLVHKNMPRPGASAGLAAHTTPSSGAGAVTVFADRCCAPARAQLAAMKP